MKNINRDFRIVFTGKKVEGEKRKRHFISGNTIHRYIGENNANKLISVIESIKVDKVTFKFRKYGKLEFYSK